jgi:ESCRT-I complex subunit TSG101
MIAPNTEMLCLIGTIPVGFKGATYNIPIKLWIPHRYPYQAPMMFVAPTANMVIKPNKHVDLQGQVYHPYLTAWAGQFGVR